jgi:predicted transcriptional regulator
MESEYDLNIELNRVYNRLADISERQRELNQERQAVETERDELLRALGRIGTYDVT